MSEASPGRAGRWTNRQPSQNARPTSLPRPSAGFEANHVRRREFLIESSRAALGVSLLSPAGWSALKQRSGNSRDIFLTARIAEWQRGIPRWLEEAKLPGVSMLLIDDGKVFWQREFGVKD